MSSTDNGSARAFWTKTPPGWQSDTRATPPLYCPPLEIPPRRCVRAKNQNRRPTILYVPLPVFFAFSERLDDRLLGHSGALRGILRTFVASDGVEWGTQGHLPLRSEAIGGIPGSSGVGGPAEPRTAKIATLCGDSRQSGSSQLRVPYAIEKLVQKSRFGPLSVGGQFGRQIRTITRRGTCH